MTDPNPYAAPRSIDAPPETLHRAGGTTKWIYLALALFIPFCVLCTRLGLFSLDVATATAIFGVVALVKGGVGLAWLYAAWSSVPTAERRTSHGNPLTPGGAVGRMLIPFYNLYWMFAVNTSLCASIDKVRATGGYGRTTDPTLAQIAAAGQIGLIVGNKVLPPLGAVAGAAVVSGFWFVFLYQTDKAIEQMVDIVRRR